MGAHYMSEPVHTSSTPGISTATPTITVPGSFAAGGTTPAGAPEVLAPTPEQPAPETSAEPKPTETVDFWKRKAREQEDRAKANAKAAERLKEIEDRDLSELQKAQRDREELAAKYAELERASLRSNVALAKGLPPEVAAILSGSTEEELTAHADALLAWRGNVPPTTPRPDPGQGPRPSTPEAEQQAEYFKFFPDEAPKAR